MLSQHRINWLRAQYLISITAAERQDLCQARHSLDSSRLGFVLRSRLPVQESSRARASRSVASATSVGGLQPTSSPMRSPSSRSAGATSSNVTALESVLCPMGEFVQGRTEMATLQRGDRVRVRGILPSSDEYDEGVVVEATFSKCRVHWSGCDEIYSENPSDLEVVKGVKR